MHYEWGLSEPSYDDIQDELSLLSIPVDDEEEDE